MSRTGELRALTSARGVAAWLVVFYHIRQSLPPVPAPVMAVIDKGYLAVDFFFLLSGFVIALAWRDRLRGSGWRAAPEFLRRRFARIWPLHAFILTGGVGLALLLWSTGRHDPIDFPFADLPLHYLLIQNWGFAYLAWNEPAWSISAELLAYLLFPAFVITIDFGRWRTMSIFAVGAAIVAIHQAGLSTRGIDRLGTDIPQLGGIRCLSEFAIGTLLFELWRRRLAIRSAVAVGLVAAILGSVDATEIVIAPLAFGAVLLLLAEPDRSWSRSLSWAPLHRLGEWSYATYLAHFLMWKAFKLAFVSVDGAVSWPLVALYLAMVFAVSAALYNVVEIPAQRCLNGRRERAEAPSATPALP